MGQSDSKIQISESLNKIMSPEYYFLLQLQNF